MTVSSLAAKTDLIHMSRIYQHKFSPYLPLLKRKEINLQFGTMQQSPCTVHQRLPLCGYAAVIFQTSTVPALLPFSLCCLFPSNSITSQLCVSPGIPPAPLAHRQTAESVGNLTQHKLCCDADISESVGCLSADGGAMEM